MRVRLHKTNNNLVPKWKKHGASSSNPSRTKHRDAAKLQLLSSLSASKKSTTDIPSSSLTTTKQDIDRVSQYSKTTLGTTATNASMIQVNARVIQVNIPMLSSNSLLFFSPNSIRIRLY
jgi:hypothetical protein